VGLDLGTSSVVSARKNGKGIRAHVELNAFIELPTSRFTEQILYQNEIDIVRENGHIVVYGNGAFKFANMFNAETRRPMRHGLVNASESYAQKLLELIVTKIVGKPSPRNSCFASAFRGPHKTLPQVLCITRH
jgi:actin-like ATPase involved in cell morphogenesis